MDISTRARSVGRPAPRWRGGRAALAAVLAAGLLAAAALPASAKAPGVNGQIVYSNSAGVFVANPDGTHAFQISDTCCAGWSPDGSHLALAASAPDGRITTEIVAPDGSGARLLPLPGATLNLGPAANGSWSPDGKRLGLQGWDDSDPSRDGVYTVASADGGGLVRVTSGYDLPEDFSPDGSMIVFNRFRPADGRSANFVVGVRGGPVLQISGWQADQSTASWSPDGKWILTDNAQGALYVVHPDGTGRHLIPLRIPAGAGAFTPGWSPDGTKIIFGLYVPTGPSTGQEGIYTANANGTGLRRVTNDALWDDGPDWGTNPVVP